MPRSATFLRSPTRACFALCSWLSEAGPTENDENRFGNNNRGQYRNQIVYSTGDIFPKLTALATVRSEGRQHPHASGRFGKPDSYRHPAARGRAPDRGPAGGLLLRHEQHLPRRPEQLQRAESDRTGGVRSCLLRFGRNAGGRRFPTRG